METLRERVGATAVRAEPRGAGLEVRPVSSGEFGDWVAAVAVGFGRDVWEEDVGRRRAVAELDRTLAAFDGAEIVGTANAYSRELSVPGGCVGAAFVTAVSVLPTHRRRGILTRMMRRQLDDVRERGEPVAVLGASESGIYGRFGYGIAAETVSFEIERARAGLAVEAEPSGRLRLVSREEALELFPGVYDQVRRETPGFLDRPAGWWEGWEIDDRYVVYEEGGRALGYLRYRLKRRWDDGLPGGELHVGELVAATFGASAALWEYAFGVDLMASVLGGGRPVDDPLYWMLADPRRLRRRPSDSLWLRILDVPAALAGRRLRASGHLVLGVRDDFLPENGGAYELVGDPDGAGCRRSSREPDVTLGAADLAAVYLGGTSPSTLARAGRVRGSREAIRLADRMFAWDPRPWTRT